MWRCSGRDVAQIQCGYSESNEIVELDCWRIQDIAAWLGLASLLAARRSRGRAHAADAVALRSRQSSDKRHARAHIFHQWRLGAR